MAHVDFLSRSSGALKWRLGQRSDFSDVDARVEVIEPTGADTLIVINFGGHEFTARSIGPSHAS